MKTKDKFLFLIFFLAVLTFLIYKIRLFVTPFILSIAISYLLNPAVNFSTKNFKCSRALAVSTIVGIFLILFIVFCAIIIPLLYSQVIVFVDSMPSYLEYFSSNFYPNIVAFFARLNIEIEHDFFDLIKNNEFFTEGGGGVGKVIANIVNSTTFFINILSIIFIMPVLIFYLLKDWHLILNKADSIIPEKYSKQVKDIFLSIDKALSGFVRGQMNVCLILAIYYAILLGLLGLNHGIFIGVLTGILAFVPYVGYGIGIATALIIAIFQWGLSLYDVGLILVVYLIGQIIESNFLVPNLIGKKVNLHPLWMIFGIFFFGSIFGILGILFSVPLTAISSVLIRHASSKKYKV